MTSSDPDFSKAYIAANELLATGKELDAFPFLSPSSRQIQILLYARLIKPGVGIMRTFEPGAVSLLCFKNTKANRLFFITRQRQVII